MDDTVEFTTPDESTDTPDSQVKHHIERDNTNILRQTGTPKNDSEHPTDTKAGGTFPVAVGRNIIGLFDNTEYTTGSAQQPGHRKLPAIPRWLTIEADDCDDNPDSHVYHNSELDDINSLQQDVGQRDDTEEDNASSNNGRKDESGSINCQTYVPGALRQDSNKEQHPVARSSTIEADNSDHNRDDSNGLQQATEDKGQWADKEKETASLNNVQKDDSGLLKNPTYVSGAVPQNNINELPAIPRWLTIEADDCDDDPDSHVYHNSDLDDINSLQQDVGQRDDTEEDNASSNNGRKDESGSIICQTYVPGALRQDSSKEQHPVARSSNIEADNSDHKRDDSNGLQQATEDNGQRADKEKETASLNNVQKDDSGLLKNPTYVSGAVPQNNINAVMSDSCPPGYKLLTSTCVRLSSRKMTYWNAKSACKKEGATLAMPKTEELDHALRDLVRMEGGNSEHWIGLKKKWCFLLHERRWKWEDGSTLSNYKGWSPGQPDNHGWRHSCVNYFAGGAGFPMWGDRVCDLRHRFICQKSSV
uniref:C-type lectin domain-containing protein n=1 Tax=Branchiostoma floridae TaxID=7739 RepID=C3YYQ7_BRAFL|eukprot:XP_002598403.1 hypothetical protein BRAFLDRAFT_83178 [Branchiostoma floridae]